MRLQEEENPLAQDKYNLRYINTKFIKEVRMLEFNCNPSLQNVLASEVDFEQELEREKEVLSRIDTEPTVDHSEPLRIFKLLQKEFKDVKWHGKNIYIASLDVQLHPPYEKHCLQGEKGNMEIVQHFLQAI